MDLAELLAALAAEGAVAGLSDDDLTAHEATLTAAVEDIDLANPSAEDLALLTSIDTATAAVRTEATARQEAADQRAAEAAEIVARIRPPEPVAEETPAEDAPAEVDEAPEPDAPAEPAPVEVPAPVADIAPPAPVAEAPQPVAVAASARNTVPARPAAPLGRAQRRAGAVHAPAPRRRDQFTLTAAADVGGLAGGQNISAEQLDMAIAAKLDSLGTRPGSGARVPVASVRTNYDEDRQFSDSDGPGNERKAKALVASARANLALVAAGGPCAAPVVDYSQNPIGSAERVLPSALVGVNATRGAVSYMQPPKIGDFAAGVSVWTQANDTTPGSDGAATKPCVTITCGSYVTARTEAIVTCATIGNFIARNDPERVEALRTLLAVEASRKIESRHLTAIGAGSMKIPKTHVLGAARDVLTRLDLMCAQARDQYRMSDNDPITVLAPRWLQDMMQADVARELPGSYAERLATSDAEIDRWFAARGINVTWLMDSETVSGAANVGATFPAAVDGTATRWPLTARLYSFPTGSWKLMDDGILNLSVSGPYHDSVLNQTNDSQIWWEEFGGVYFQGTWSRRLDLEVCPSGSTSATTAVGCLTGS